MVYWLDVIDEAFEDVDANVESLFRVSEGVDAHVDGGFDRVEEAGELKALIDIGRVDSLRGVGEAMDIRGGGVEGEEDFG